MWGKTSVAQLIPLFPQNETEQEDVGQSASFLFILFGGFDKIKKKERCNWGKLFQFIIIFCIFASVKSVNIYYNNKLTVKNYDLFTRSAADVLR